MSKKNKNNISVVENNPAPSNNGLTLTVHQNFADDYVDCEGSQKKEIIRRLDRISETGSCGSNDTERRNLAKGLVEVKFKSGIRVYGGIRKIDGKDSFFVVALGGKGDAAKQNRDIQKATELYVRAVEQDAKKPARLNDEVTFNEVSEMNKKQFKKFMTDKYTKTA